MTIADLYESRKDDPLWNTSYPLSPEDWARYRVPGFLPFDEKEMSFYIHIPFCRQLCSFCEYTRMICPPEDMQENYLMAVVRDIRQFRARYTDIVLKGFDIGGGTPMSLSDQNFGLLMEIYSQAVEGLTLADDFEPSVEASFGTLSEHKLCEMVKRRILRLSVGVQSSCRNVLSKHERTGYDEDGMQEWLRCARSVGIRKINLDFMYGLKGQNLSCIGQDLDLIGRLHPEQVTLYEFRANMLNMRETLPKEELFTQYVHYYEGLIALGYKGRFGQNTFSLDPADWGVSSYLRDRMLNGGAYKGFGLSAQSMSGKGVSYNLGKSSSNPKQYLGAAGYPEEFTYLLPPSELASKYMAISAYNGSFSIERLLSLGFVKSRLDEILAFCYSQDLLYPGSDGRVIITRKGFMYYGAVFSLFSATGNGSR